LDTTLDCPAPAKLNLFLHVVGRRPDGYHLLQTLFRFLDYADTLHFTLRTDGAIHRQDPLAGIPPEQDLCVLAAQHLQAAAGVGLGADIALAKRIPVGGGLGGGSSDAATTLLALNRLWGLGWSRERLQRLGLELGADVPVFVYGRSAFAEGIGEQLRAAALPPAWYLVLTPPLAVSTAEVFSDPELTRNSDRIKIPGFSAVHQETGAGTLEIGTLAAEMLGSALPPGGVGRNDLEAVVCRRYPLVAAHLAWLRQFGPAALSGSGACVFAAFGSEEAARAAQRQLPQSMRGFVARGIDRHPLFDWV
jgi:4-diphosphocytidyl-2-C-methyl-D-erythritol kinase